MKKFKLTRRTFLQYTGGVLTLAGFNRLANGNASSTLPPVRAISRGPKFHWFSYYDKLQFDPSGRFVLGMEVDFEHQSPKADDVIKIGIVDLEDNDRWIELGESRSWCWQQGCMLQWLPGSSTDSAAFALGDGAPLPAPRRHVAAGGRFQQRGHAHRRLYDLLWP